MAGTGATPILLGILFVSLLAGCLKPTDEPGEAGFAAEIRWTQYGIPHVKADSWRGLGYGYGYAYARDNLCVLAEEIVTLNGERSKFFGPEGMPQAGYLAGDGLTNQKSDFFFSLLKQHPDLITSSFDFAPTQVQDAADGFAAGYNRFLREADGPAIGPCAGEPWVRRITTDDLARRVHKLQLFASMYQFAVGMYDAQPPAGPAPVAPSPPSGAWGLGWIPSGERIGFGSNGYAFGRGATSTGAGMLLVNPHFPWSGPERFHQFHFTIPGQVDVMGMSLQGIPLVLIGFTDEYAWTHTVSTGWRFSIYELDLVPGDPTSYYYEGSPRKMTQRQVTIQVPQGGGFVDQTRTYHFSHYGPIIDVDAVAATPIRDGLAWTTKKAYAIRDANAHNSRLIQQFYDFNTAPSWEEFKASIERNVAVPWVNTIAASRSGDAFYADISVVPNLPAAVLENCMVPVGRALFQLARLPVLDGSKAACEWRKDPDAPQDGILPADELPQATRDDYLINSNDSHWLPHPQNPLEGYSAMIGDERTARSGRTRMGYVQIEERLDGKADCTIDANVACEKFTPARLQDLLFADRALFPEMVRADLLRGACQPPVIVTSRGAVDVSEACRVLGQWDLRSNPDSRGYVLFDVFWMGLPPTGQVWKTPFDARDPVNTPRDLTTENPVLREALANAVQTLQGAKIPLDVAPGDVRYVTRNDERIPLHGAPGQLGSPSFMMPPWEPGKGFVEVSSKSRAIHGNSYVSTVTWDDRGPVAYAVLTYSQSTNPASPHYADQTRLYAEKGWNRLPFSEQEIRADPWLADLSLRE